MGSLILKRGVKLELTPEQRAELAALAEMKDEDIDYSDIPAPKEGEERKWYPVNPRTPEQWKRYYKYCPPHIQARHKKLRELYGPII